MRRPWGLRRNPDRARALPELADANVELAYGSFTELDQVQRALEGAWGAFVNTDGFTVGEKTETLCGLRIFELAVRVPTLEHYVWSNLDYGLKKGLPSLRRLDVLRPRPRFSFAHGPQQRNARTHDCR